MSVRFDLSGLVLCLSGLPDVLRGRLEEGWGAFRAGETATPFLEIEVRAENEIEDDGTTFAPKKMSSEFKGGTARYAMNEGSAEVPHEGRVRIRLAPASAARQYWALVNLVTAAVAFRLPSRGGALLHAAGIVLGERAFLLVGPEGSGKSSWARLARAAGACALSDDVVVVEPGGSGVLEALATPFRTLTATPGRWPVALFLLPRQGAAAALEPVPSLAIRARIGANLPFFAEAWTVDPRVERVVEGLSAAVPARRLTFALDPSYLDLLRSFHP